MSLHFWSPRRWSRELPMESRASTERKNIDRTKSRTWAHARIIILLQWYTVHTLLSMTTAPPSPAAIASHAREQSLHWRPKDHMAFTGGVDINSSTSISPNLVELMIEPAERELPKMRSFEVGWRKRSCSRSYCNWCRTCGEKEVTMCTRSVRTCKSKIPFQRTKPFFT